MADFLAQLRLINAARALEWMNGAASDPLFWAVELGGETGEILNVVKKLRREELGWRGSRASVDDLADEIADGIICLDSLARHYGIDLEAAVVRKFNATSDKVGLPHKLEDRS
jgi:NTP pyrophosphatase (non-canonical NTP hydrolase)